jgi:hypothetical protein
MRGAMTMRHRRSVDRTGNLPKIKAECRIPRRPPKPFQRIGRVVAATSRADVNNPRIWASVD